MVDGVPPAQPNVFSGNRKRLLENFLSLSSVLALNNVLSLVTVPYLTRALGPASYGLVGFIIAFMTYFSVFSDYGFNLSATRSIARNREDAREVSRIFSAVLVIKLALVAICFVIVCGLVLSVQAFSADRPLYFIYFLGVAGSALYPLWLFQGFEKMKFLAFLHVSVRALATGAIFILVDSPTDTPLLIWIYTLANVATGVLSLAIGCRMFSVRFVLPSADRIRMQLKDGGYVFLSTAGSLIYTSSTAFALGLFTNHEVVGYFTGADKIRMAIQGLFAPVSQTLYPYICNLAQHSRQKAWKFIKLEAGVVVVAGLAIFALLYAYADGIAVTVLGEAYAPSAEILKIMSILPLLTLLGNVLTVQYLLSMGLNREYLHIYAISSAAGLICIILFSFYHGAIGAAWAVVVAESTVIVLAAAKIDPRRDAEPPADPRAGQRAVDPG